MQTIAEFLNFIIPSIQVQTDKIFYTYLNELGTSNENSLQLAIVQLIITGEEAAIDRGRQLILQARQELTDEANNNEHNKY